MGRPWHEADPRLYSTTKEEVERQFPSLHFVIRNQIAFVRGSLLLQDEGRSVDRYIIELEIPRNFPERIPIVREIGGRIPRILDRHFQADGAACLFVEAERWKVWPRGASLVDFLNGPVKNFFLGESVHELTGEWPFGARSHRAAGIYETFSELLETTDRGVIRAYIDVLRKKQLKGHWDCPCGSRRRLRDCHAVLVASLREKIPADVAKRTWEAIQKQSVPQG